jgi:CubicO group peptidase (beta-lactamase class C family)
MRSKTSLALAVLLAAAAPTAGQQHEPTPYERAIAAGYKALTLCSGIFNAGRSQAQIEALELTGIYPEYDAIVPTLSAEVRSFRTEPGAQRSPPAVWAGEVSVRFTESLAPRIARWHVNDGCTILPIGDPGNEGPGMLRVWGSPTPVAGSMDGQQWPIGDRDATATAPPALAAPIARAFDGRSYGAGRTTGVVIVHNGRILGEHYAEGFGMHVSQRTWSVAKSISGTLIGIAVRDHLLFTQRRVAVPEWNDFRGNIRLDDLLRMASGLHSATAGNRTDAVYFGGTTVTQEAGYWPLEAQPGTRFRYANSDILLAIRALRAAINNDERYHAFPRTQLFAPLGMTRTVAETDWDGNFILSSQVWSTARDLARLGQFWLDDGVWQGRRILPEGWMRYMTTPSGPQPATGPGYGATMWLFGPAQGLPAGSYAAQGNRGQYAMVVPSRHLIVVRRGEDGGDMRFDIARFTADVMAALP